MEDNNIDSVIASYNHLKAIHQAANNANDLLVKENNELRDKNKFLSEQFVHIEKTLEIQKTIVRNNIAESQAKHERDYEEITILKEKIKKLEIENSKLKSR